MRKLFEARPARRYSSVRLLAVSILCALVVIDFAVTTSHVAYARAALPHFDHIVIAYARKHNPWADFSDVAGNQTNQPFASFPAAFAGLPTVSFVVPNKLDDMHSGSISAADSWLRDHLDGYVRWAKTHNSLFILTWDEDSGTSANHIATIFVGAHVKVGHYSEFINHYNVLRTIEAIYGLAITRNAANVATITDVWM